MTSVQRSLSGNKHAVFVTPSHVRSHTRALRWDVMGSDGMSCAGNSTYFSGGVHTLSYQRSPYHRTSMLRSHVRN